MQQLSSFKSNVLTNYAAQVYVTILGILVLPLYLKFMGAEAYGLVGFFFMMQVWFSLLDVGLTPTVARETSRFRGGAISASSYLRLIRVLEIMFFLMALLGGGAMFLSAGYISRDWLQVSGLKYESVEHAVQLMAVTVSLRWICGLYRGSISGSEKLVWLSAFNSFIATARYLGVLPALHFIGGTASVFFYYQLAVSALELLCLICKAYGLLPEASPGKQLGEYLESLKSVTKFSLPMAFVASVWVFVTQTDKLVLSKILSLSEYGYYTLAVLVANGVMVVSGPVSAAIMPRMARLEAEGRSDDLVRLYRRCTQLVVVMAGSAAITMAFYGELLLLAWTGNAELSRQVGPILTLYAMGNGCLAISGFAYYLQYAKGNLKLHVIGNAIFIIVLIPLIAWAAQNHGGKGAGYVWLSMNFVYLICWVPLVHRKIIPNINVEWFVKDVFIIFVAASITGYVMHVFLPEFHGRFLMIMQIILVGVTILCASVMASSVARSEIGCWLTRVLNKRRVHGNSTPADQ